MKIAHMMMVLAAAFAAQAESEFRAVSPDGLNEVRLETGEGGMAYSVWRNGKALVEPTRISLVTREHGRMDGAKATPVVTQRTVAGTVATPLYKKSAVDLAANETRVDFGDWALVLHARNDGVAWRFETKFEGEATVTAENTNVRFPKDTMLCYGQVGGFATSFERPATIGPVSSVKSGHPQIVITPLTASVPGAGVVCVTESNLLDYPGLNFYRVEGEDDTLRSWQAGVPKTTERKGRWIRVKDRHPYLAKTAGTRAYPWRVFVLGDTPSDLVAADTVYALAEPSRLADTSWVKPGLVQWDWWHGFKITDVPGLKSGCNYETYRAYVDYAAANGIPYIIMDEGWSEHLNLDQPREAVNVSGVIDYGKEKGVGVILWAAWSMLADPADRARVFDRYAAMGAKGFKIDFMDRDDQDLERFLEATAADAAARKLVVMYHGIHKPTGLCRTFPNVLNYEGVYGLEQGHSRGGQQVVVANDVNLPYTRMVAGAMDYTPGAMRNRAFDAPEFRKDVDAPACYGTRCHQLALFPIFEAPVQMLCDSPTQYRTASECLAFMSQVPTVWDETVGVAGEIGQFASVARRKGGDWWLGAITNWERRELELPTTFLGAGAWTVEAFEDAPDADKNAEHYVRRTFTIKAGDPLKVCLAPGGGFAAKFVRAPADVNASVRVMTYNVRNSQNDKNSPDNNWNGRREDFARLVERENPDVVGFQEVLPDQRKWLEARFPGYAFVGDGRNADRVHGEASPIAFRKARFEALKCGTFWLSETPDVPGSKSWNAAFPRICSYAVLKDKTTGRTFAFANTHTDHRSEAAREKGMLLVIERMKEFSGNAPVVFVGDHNCLEYEAPSVAVSKILKDAMYLSETTPEGSWRTFNFWSYKEKELSIAEALRQPVDKRSVPGDKSDQKRIDYIYVSPGTRVLAYRTLPATRPGTQLYPSDHFPSVADLVIGATPAEPYVVVAPGRAKLVFDTSSAPDLRHWTEEKFAPAMVEWVAKLGELMKSDGWTAPDEIRFAFVDSSVWRESDCPAWACPSERRVNLRADWFRKNLGGEALGCTIHELVHIFQGYWTDGHTAENCPIWASEGYADYVRWFLFEPEADGCAYVRKNPAKYHYNDSYRVTAHFFDFVERRFPGTMKKLNAALRDHTFDNGTFWEATTGDTAEALELLWKAAFASFEGLPIWLADGIAKWKEWAGDAARAQAALAAAKARPKFDAGGEITACFVDWIVRNVDAQFVEKLEKAASEGRFGEALWVELTGRSRLRLGCGWRNEIMGIDTDPTLVSTADAADILDWVDPFLGSGGTGHTTPAATHPFGMVQPGPDTGNKDWAYCAGYQYTDPKIARFSQLHISGTGCYDSYDVSFMPFCGTVDAEKGDDFWAAYEKKDEKATPGYYGVALDNGTTVEMTATRHAAIYRITFREDGAKLLFDPAWGSRVITVSEVSKMADRRVTGQIARKGWSPHAYWFTWEVSEAPVSETVIEEVGDTKVPKTVYAFDLPKGGVLYLKVALSRTSAAAAQRNIDAEIPGWDFDGVLAATRAKWRALVGRVRAKGTKERLKTLYAALYHLMFQPNLISDFGEPDVYSTFSCWDTYRAAGPLYTILAPEYVPDFVNSFIWHFDRHGFLPIWTLWDHDNQCMIGVHSEPMLVDAYLKGFGGVDWNRAFDCVKASLTPNETMKKRWKAEYDILDQWGYYPYDKLVKNGGKEGVSRLLEGNYNDACAARLARGLGRDADAKYFEDRSHGWTNCYDAATGFVRAKDSKGNFREPFDPFALLQSDPLRDNKIVYSLDYCEGNAWHYNWHQMHDWARMIELEGGKEKAVEKLQRLFTVNPYRGNSGGDGNESGLLGQYCHGNEPCHHVIYYFTLMGRRDLAAKYAREVAETLYSADFMGLCGNEDCGQMSAWYVFSSMGFYPFDPCGQGYVFGEALYPELSIDVGGGKRFVIRSDGAGAPVVRLNGRVVEGPGLSHSDVMNGGELSFEGRAR